MFYFYSSPEECIFKISLFLYFVFSLGICQPIKYRILHDFLITMENRIWENLQGKTHTKQGIQFNLCM